MTEDLNSDGHQSH